tara:strand:- start:768 stop:1223 length:456 start_codon:yes stop_codon:yes gene_type:complete
MKLPDLRFEYTATRPWTFSHPNFSFSNRNVSIGATNGPSSISLRVESFFIPNPNLKAKISFEKIYKGIGLGSDINDNYDHRNKLNDWTTKILLNQNYAKNIFELKIHYYLTNMVRLLFDLKALQTTNPQSYKNYSQNEIETEFMIGFDLTW